MLKAVLKFAALFVAVLVLLGAFTSGEKLDQWFAVVIVGGAWIHHDLSKKHAALMQQLTRIEGELDKVVSTPFH